MTHDAIRASFALRGHLARSAKFAIHEEDTLDLVADLVGPGRILRAFRTLPLNAPDEDIEAALGGLYADLTGLPQVADTIGARSFSEHLDADK